MTLEAAKELAGRQPAPHLVFRLPKWPANAWAVIAERPLPAEAEVVRVPCGGGQGTLF